MRMPVLLLCASLTAPFLFGDADVSIGIHATATTTAAVVKNNGPSTATNIVFCSADPSQADHFVCADPFTLEAGALREFPFTGGIELLKVSAAESDPDPSNNAFAVEVGTGDFKVVAVPAVPRAGETLSLVIGYSAAQPAREIHFTSSDPTVIALPSTISIPPGLDAAAIAIRPLRGGGVTITATNSAGWKSSLTIHVADMGQPAASVATIAFTAVPAVWSFASQMQVTVAVSGLTFSEATPAGTVTLLVDGAPYATAQISGNAAPLVFPTPPIGTHTIRAAYAGDANFYPAATESQTIVVVPGPVSAYAIRTHSAADVLVIVKGGNNVPPTGSISVSGSSVPNSGGPLTPFGDAAASFVVQGVHISAKTITVSYSGDANYAAQTLTTLISSERRRSVQH